MPLAANIMLLLTLSSLNTTSPADGVKWAKDYKSAIQQAEAEQKALMVMFTATW